MTKAIGAGLTPDQAQRTFRVVLDALARPGLASRLPDVPGLPAALLPALALADLDTPACVLADRDAGRWADVLATATGAPVVGPDTARLVAALRPPRPAELAAVPRGTAAAPERGALVALTVPALDGGAPLRLAGPGVDGSVTVAPSGLLPGLLAARAEAVAAFPAGIDLLLVTHDGLVLGLPRGTRIEEGD
jgi:alpha-D-ribose 1-methylphosphonate 5-triphosphate synthase subunit PhnH